MSHKTWEISWEGDLPGTPDQIWDGFTKHSGGWLWPITYEPRVGGAERGLTSKGGIVTVWEPPSRFVTEAPVEGGINRLDYRIDGSHLRLTHHGCVRADEFELQHDACVRHTNLYYHSLGAYLEHFADREPHYLGLDEVPGATADVLRRLGIPEDAAVGDEVELGVVDYRDGTFVGVRADDALIRVYGREVWGWPVGVGIHTFDGRADEQGWRKRLEVV